MSILAPTRLALIGLLVTAAHAAQADNVVTKIVDLGPQTLPAIQNYGTVFLGSPTGYTNADITSLGVTLTSADTFYENYAFEVPEAQVVSLTSSVSLGSLFGVGDLQARLYRGTAADVITGAAGPALVVAWGQSFSAGSSSVTQALIVPTVIGAGDYVLQVRGRVFGAAGGSYTGTLQAAVVPEPGTWALFGSGILGLAAVRRRFRGQGHQAVSA
jgi:PEP-CTERM motif